MAKSVLIVYHSQSGNTEAAAQAVAKGVRSTPGVDCVVKVARDADSEDLLACDAVCVGTPDYFSYMAGMLKDFFDRTLYPTQGRVDDKPCAVFVTHGGGGKAVDSVEKICRSFRFKQSAESVLVRGGASGNSETELHELGAALAMEIA